MTGPVRAFTLRDPWRHLEHDWEAGRGTYAFEPPGETHTLVVPDGVDDMAKRLHVTGGYVDVEPDGVALGDEDVFTQARQRSRMTRRSASPRTLRTP